MSYGEAVPGRARAEDEFSTANYRFRYAPGIVGESKRVVHQAVFTDGTSVWSLCRRQFAIADIEEIGRCGMPCMACTGQAAVASNGQIPVLEEGSHSEQEDKSPFIVEGGGVR